MPLKILLADDSMTAQNMGKKILVDAGYDVVAVSNGAAAIKKVASERPDIAILDEYMPGYTGSEVCERIKAAAETAKIPVLLTVGKMEPFDPEKANKVRADGVMIKPFEASDLVAAIQSIAQRLLAPAPVSRNLDATVQLRSPGDTGRIFKPQEPDHEDTLRLTAEQIKAFQDASYHEWANNAEPHLEAQEKPAAAPVAEMPVAPAAEVEPTVAIPHDTAEMLRAAISAELAKSAEAPATPRETPVYNALSASGVAAEHEILNGNGPVAPVDEPAAPVFYTPPVAVESAPESTATPAFAVEPVAPAEPESVSETPVISVSAPEPVIPESTVEVPEIAVPEAVMVEPVVEAAPVMVEPVVDTSTVVVASAPVLETSVPPIEVAASPAPELEITSLPQERGPYVTQDPALVTESEDISQFTTRFGVENAEPVHVGMVSDLSDEQLAAIISSPPEEEELLAEAPEVAAPEIPAPEVERSVVEEMISAPAPVEPEPAPVVAEAIPSMHAVDPVEVPEPIVSPALSTEPALTYTPEPEPIVEAPVAEAPVAVEGAVPEPEAVSTQPVVEPGAEVSAPALEPELAPFVETAAAETPTAAETEAVTSAVEGVATEATAIAPQQPSDEHVRHAVETALAAAAAIGAAPGIAHVIHAEPGQVQEPAVREAESYSFSVAGPMGDAALAEELAAAIARKETEERAKAAAEVAATAAREQVFTEAVAPAAELGIQGLTDNRLADAVARAFESLKPQLITEIIKELSK